MTSGREGARQLLEEFDTLWLEFKASLKGREIEDKALAWSMFCNNASKKIYDEGAKARKIVNEKGRR